MIKLNEKARKRILDTIEAERAVGSRQVATDIEMLLKVHDEVHQVKEAGNGS
ncbi:hypothetical protein [Aminobacter phage Erebus]|nr:hypothetical protein [Aminobacter phage Erebus]